MRKLYTNELDESLTSALGIATQTFLLKILEKTVELVEDVDSCWFRNALPSEN